MAKGRPDFSAKTADTLAKRAAQWCSKPSCENQTSGPHSEKRKAINLGEAAHIRGARPGSARYDPSMTDEQRADIFNGIWLCTGCAREIDKDEITYPVKLLLMWKGEHEQLVRDMRGKTHSEPYLQKENMELRRETEELQRILKSKEDFERRYALVHAPGGDHVYASTGDDPHYACQSCWGKEGNEQILKIDSAHFGTFVCPGCKNVYHINPSQQRQQDFASGMTPPRGKYGWMA